jgi:4-hydroxy-2-oxoheptanedioate aldolase
MNIHRCIGLLKQRKPIFVCHPSIPPELSFESGRKFSGTWADLLVIEFEHYGLNSIGLSNFMQGIRDATPSSDSMVTVMATLPVSGNSVESVNANAWQIRQLLATGIHGLILAQASDVRAIANFVQTSRFSHHRQRQDVLGSGCRGAGGEDHASRVWNVSKKDYWRLADPWPLNPDGELLLGLKIENRESLCRVNDIASVPGIAFAEWGPADMAMSFEMPDAQDPPYPESLYEAMNTVRKALSKAGVRFYCGWNNSAISIEEQVDFLLDDLGAEMLWSPSAIFAAYGRSR